MKIPIGLKKFCCPFQIPFQFILTLVGIGWNWVYDIPMLLSEPLRENVEFTDENIQTLYSAYSLPCLFTSIIFGVLLAKKGPCLMYICLISIFCGQCFFYLGICLKDISLAIIGRILIGMGSEPAIVTAVYSIKLFANESEVLL